MELKIELPKELEYEFKMISKTDLSISANTILKEELTKLLKLKKIVSKSKLTEKQAEEVSNEISEALAERYDRLLQKGKS